MTRFTIVDALPSAAVVVFRDRPQRLRVARRVANRILARNVSIVLVRDGDSGCYVATAYRLKNSGGDETHRPYGCVGGVGGK